MTELGRVSAVMGCNGAPIPGDTREARKRPKSSTPLLVHPWQTDTAELTRRRRHPLGMNAPIQLSSHINHPG